MANKKKKKGFSLIRFLGKALLLLVLLSAFIGVIGYLYPDIILRLNKHVTIAEGETTEEFMLAPEFFKRWENYIEAQRATSDVSPSTELPPMHEVAEQTVITDFGKADDDKESGNTSGSTIEEAKTSEQLPVKKVLVATKKKNTKQQTQWEYKKELTEDALYRKKATTIAKTLNTKPSLVMAYSIQMSWLRYTETGETVGPNFYSAGIKEALRTEKAYYEKLVDAYDLSSMDPSGINTTRTTPTITDRVSKTEATPIQGARANPGKTVRNAPGSIKELPIPEITFGAPILERAWKSWKKQVGVKGGVTEIDTESKDLLERQFHRNGATKTEAKNLVDKLTLTENGKIFYREPSRVITNKQVF